jgi:hypothetical protein
MLFVSSDNNKIYEYRGLAWSHEPPIPWTSFLRLSVSWRADATRVWNCYDGEWSWLLYTSTCRTSFGSVPETPNIKEQYQEQKITSNYMTIHMPRNTVCTGGFLLVNQLSDRYSALSSCRHNAWFRQQWRHYEIAAELLANKQNTALRQLLTGDKAPPLWHSSGLWPLASAVLNKPTRTTSTNFCFFITHDVFEDVTLCRWVFPDVSEGRNAFVLRDTQVTLSIKEQRPTKRPTTHPVTQRHIPDDLNL